MAPSVQAMRSPALFVAVALCILSSLGAIAFVAAAFATARHSGLAGIDALPDDSCIDAGSSDMVTVFSLPAKRLIVALVAFHVGGAMTLDKPVRSMLLDSF